MSCRDIKKIILIVVGGLLYSQITVANNITLDISAVFRRSAQIASIIPDPHHKGYFKIHLNGTASEGVIFKCKPLHNLACTTFDAPPIVTFDDKGNATSSVKFNLNQTLEMFYM